MSFKKRIVKRVLLESLNEAYEEFISPEIEESLNKRSKGSSILPALALVLGSLVPSTLSPAPDRATRKALERLNGTDVVAPVEYTRISSEFGKRVHPVTGEQGKMHQGVDFAAPEGTPVVASMAGRVSRVGWDKTGGGNRVWIDHGGGLETVYMHLQDYTVEKGQVVEQGELIGHVGSTGQSTGPHLHYGMRFKGQYINPLETIPVEAGTQALEDEGIPSTVLAQAQSLGVTSTHAVTPAISNSFEAHADDIYHVFDSYQIPHEIASLIVIESNAGLSASASSAGALGPWQIMPSVGKAYGLATEADFYDWNKSTRVAARLLNDNFKYFHNWYLALMAYNAGMGNIQKAMKKAGISRKSSYTMDEIWKVWHHVSKETKGYLLQFFDIQAQVNPSFSIETLIIDSGGPLQP